MIELSRAEKKEKDQGIAASIGVALFLRRVGDKLNPSDFAILGQAFDAVGIEHHSTIRYSRTCGEDCGHQIQMLASADELVFVFDTAGALESAHGEDHYW